MESDEDKFNRQFTTALIVTVFDKEFYPLIRSLQDMPFLPENNVLDLTVIRVPNVDSLYRYDVEPSKERTEDGAPLFMTVTLEYFKTGARETARIAYEAYKQEQETSNDV